MAEIVEDIIRVIRIIQYTGPRSAVEKQVDRSLHGMREITTTGVTITATTLGLYPDILFKGIGLETKDAFAEVEDPNGKT